MRLERSVTKAGALLTMVCDELIRRMESEGLDIGEMCASGLNDLRYDTVAALWDDYHAAFDERRTLTREERSVSK